MFTSNLIARKFKFAHFSHKNCGQTASGLRNAFFYADFSETAELIHF